MSSNIEDLNKKIKNCRKCRLFETRKNALCGEGNLKAKIMLIAQAPGIKEDQEETMFIGPSGKVLNNLLRSSNIQRDNLYMTNLIKCMHPNYRKPKQDEIDICSNYLGQEIKLIDPDVLVPLDHYATKYLLEKNGLKIPSKKRFLQTLWKIIFNK